MIAQPVMPIDKKVLEHVFSFNKKFQDHRKSKTIPYLTLRSYRTLIAISSIIQVAEGRRVPGINKSKGI